MIVVPARPTTATRRRRPSARRDVQGELDASPQRRRAGSLEADAVGLVRRDELAGAALDDLDRCSRRGQRRAAPSAQVVDDLALGQHPQHIGFEVGRGTPWCPGTLAGPASFAFELRRSAVPRSQAQRPGLVAAVALASTMSQRPPSCWNASSPIAFSPSVRSSPTLDDSNRLRRDLAGGGPGTCLGRRRRPRSRDAGPCAGAGRGCARPAGPLRRTRRPRWTRTRSSASFGSWYACPETSTALARFPIRSRTRSGAMARCYGRKAIASVLFTGPPSRSPRIELRRDPRRGDPGSSRRRHSLGGHDWSATRRRAHPWPRRRRWSEPRAREAASRRGRRRPPTRPIGSRPRVARRCGPRQRGGTTTGTTGSERDYPDRPPQPPPATPPAIGRATR